MAAVDEYAFYGVILALSKEVDHEVLPIGLKEFLKDFESGLDEIEGLKESINEIYVSEILAVEKYSTKIH
jgi:hypothetical protein